MDPEAQLIAAQAAEELARQQSTGTVDELQRGRMAQQILQGAGQQAQAREAQQAQADFARRKRLGDVVAAGEAQKRIQDYQKKTQQIRNMFDAGLGTASVFASQYGDYLAQQNALAEGLAAAEAKGGVEGAVDFLNANPDYDPGQEALQRIIAENKASTTVPHAVELSSARSRFLERERALPGFNPSPAKIRQADDMMFYKMLEDLQMGGF